MIHTYNYIHEENSKAQKNKKVTKCRGLITLTKQVSL